jgi:hypothetical protein
MTLEGLFDKIKKIMEGDSAEEEQRPPPSVEDPNGDPADSSGPVENSRRYAHENTDRENIVPASQDSYGDPAGTDRNIRPASEDPDGDPADTGR